MDQTSFSFETMRKKFGGSLLGGGLHRQCFQISFLLLLFLSSSLPVVRAVTEDGAYGYIAETDVSQLLNLAYDIRDIRATNDFDQKRKIYEQGSNALPYTLMGLSLNSSQYKDFPLYNVYTYAFYELGIAAEDDEPGQFDGMPVEQYANTLVNDLFYLNATRIEADGALVLNVVMAYWGSLFQMLQACQVQGGRSTMVSFLDQAAALWIGAGQQRTSNNKGYMLYNLAELAGTNFEQDQSDGESKVNVAVLETFVLLKSEIDNSACSSDEGYRDIRLKVKELVKYTNTVLVQMLLYHIEETKNADFVELYTLSLLPQIGACNSDAIDTLVGNTVKSSLTDDAKPDVIAALQDSYSCLFLECQDVGAYQGDLIEACSEPELSFAGYVPTTDVRYKSFIDRDVRQIRMFMRMESYEAAKDIYQNGWNSFFSLQGLATNTAFSLSVNSTENERLQLYTEDENFSDNTILNALDQNAPYDSASAEDKMEIVLGILEGIVMYISMISQLESAVAACVDSSSPPETASAYWDTGVAFFVGSLEGATEDLAERGQLMFGLAKNLCSSFSTCESDDASVNVELLNSLEFGRNTLSSDGGCTSVQAIINADVKPFLSEILIQATLYFSTFVAPSSFGDGSAGALYAFSRAILPAVNDVSRSSAATIKENTDFSADLSPDVDDIFISFSVAIPDMKIDCERVGVITTNSIQRGVCPNNVPVVGGSTTSSPATQSGPDGLAWGRYTFIDEAASENDSMFALDVRDMATASDVNAADTAYSNPSKYATNGLTGILEMKSLSDLSTTALSIMKNDPLYNYYLVAFFDDSELENMTASGDNFAYGETIVRLALDPNKGNSPQLASDASVVLNCFMIIVHRLYDSVRQCREQIDSASMIDSAVALWIGQGQAEGKFDSGWMMYAQGQQAAELYGKPEEEAAVNTELMNLFNEAQTTAKSCSSSADSFKVLRVTTEAIIRNLSNILLQRLLFHVSENSRNYVELFALTFIPQAVSCDAGAYEYLRDTLFLDFDRTVALNSGLVSRLAKVLQCLRYSCSDLGDTQNASVELKNLVSSLCSEVDNYSQKGSIAGYITDSDVSEVARIDLDILQIEIFMKTRAYDLADELYTSGRNSLDGAGNPISLRTLATDTTRTDAGDIYTAFYDYFNSATYADDIIRRAINATKDNGDAFESASRLQRSEAVVRTLQTMVPYMQIVSKLEQSISHCEATQSGQLLIDEAAALFTGSIEEQGLGEDSDGSGMMLFALGQEACAEFDECKGYDDASLNEFVLVSLGDMKRFISANNCTAAGVILKDVLWMLPIPMIQKTLSLSVANSKLEARSENETLATAYVLSSAVLPLVAKANATSAGTILKNMDFNLDIPPVVEGPEAVFTAFRGALSGMGINCQYVGSLEEDGLSTCDTASVTLDVNASTKLGGDLYVSTTNVQDRANIALDIKNMEDALLVGREALATIIYREGENSPVYTKDGVLTDLRSLAKFSTEANLKMKENPVYQTAVYALRDNKGKYLGEEAWEYADTIVKEALASGAKTHSPIAAEAAVALNLWMELANELFQTLVNCKNRKIVDDDGIHSIDEAAAYWIGDGQVSGSAEPGHLLYSLAEQMGDIFKGADSAAGQANVNVNILLLFHQAKIELSLPGACADPATYRRLRHVVNQIITQMVIVNMQALIHNLLVDDQPRVRIYAHAVVPLIAACSPSTFSYLKEKLIDNSYNVAEVNAIIGSLRSTYPCFNMVCEDVGSHPSDATTCQNPNANSALAGYTPSTDVRNFAKLDLDIQELEILLQMEAYGAAEDLYKYGKHTTMSEGGGDNSVLSLELMATDPTRSDVPQFGLFTQYYGEDEQYADTIIRFAFLGNNRLSVEERRIVVVGMSQYMILYMGILQAMEAAASACDSGTSDATAGVHWDTAASWLIGSLEGSTEAGSQDGRLLWALAKDSCHEFGTCSSSAAGSASVNDRILLKLYSGRGAVLARSCSELRQTATELSHLMPIPLIQAALSIAGQLEATKAGSPQQKELLAKGYVYSQAILPLIQVANPNAAAMISMNFDLNGESSPHELAAIVAAYNAALSGLGTSCQDVGSSETMDVCAGTVQSPATTAGIVLGVILGLLVLACAGYCFWRRRIRSKSAEEMKPIFQKNHSGELNHTSEVAGGGGEEGGGFGTQRLSEEYQEDFEEKKEEMPGERDHFIATAQETTTTRGASPPAGNKRTSSVTVTEDDDSEDADVGIQVV